MAPDIETYADATIVCPHCNIAFIQKDVAIGIEDMGITGTECPYCMEPITIKAKANIEVVND